MNDEVCGWKEGIQFIPKAVWRWHVFGTGMVGNKPFTVMVVEFPYDVPLWHRILTRIVLRSEWEKLS